MLTFRIAGLLLAGVALAGCSGLGTGDAGNSAGNSAGNGAGSGAGSASGDRVAALHAAAECLRQHGVRNFADPVLGANGEVYTDTRALDSIDRAQADAISSVCARELGAANWNPGQQPPAPAALVAAGVRAARCMRENGLPAFHDPTADSPYTPGHGLGMRAEDLPPGADKQTPAVQHAMQACRELLDAEIRASALDQLAGR
ncbi:MAG TPA: hypothetical protein VGJ95_18385 [Pseudonocardiaceae bacterium]